MKASLALLTSLTAVAALTAGCSSSSTADTDAATGNHELETVGDGELLVKADLPSPGWYNGDTVADIDSGFDFCLLANIAHRAGIDDVSLQHTSFDGLVAGKAGDFDLSLNQITITDERREVMDFSDPYFQSTAGILACFDSLTSPPRTATWTGIALPCPG